MMGVTAASPPMAPPLRPDALFHRPALSPFTHAPFRAKANPFTLSPAGDDNAFAPRSSTTTTTALSSPPASAHSHHLSVPSGSGGGSVSSPGSGARARGGPSPHSSAGSNGSAPWKAHLRQQCLQRVKAQRLSLQQKLRDAHTTTAATMSDSIAAAAAQASAALANSLRDIIQEQYAEQRQHNSNRAPASAASASSSSVYSAAASSSSAAAASTFASSAAAAVAPSPVVSDDGDDFPSFTAGDDFLSQDELIELMEQLEEEVRREEQPGSCGPNMSATASSAVSSNPFGSSASAATSASAAAAAAEYALAAAYAAEAAAQQQADMEALDEYYCEQAQQQGPTLLPCPLCHRASSVSVAQGQASCHSCDMRYAPCESADELRQTLWDACELHAQRCAAPPKFVAPTSQQQQQPLHHAAAAASSIPTAPIRAPLALACEVCRTWLTLPVAAPAGWTSQPCSQSDNADDDCDMAM